MRAFARVSGRGYRRCERCLLTFMRPRDLPAPPEERERYTRHHNRPDDPGYRAFLSGLLDPLLERLPAGAEGLDFGSGPGPTASVMLEERGHPMRIYDPFFAPDAPALERDYHFITCTETFEHFHHPGREIERLDGMLRPGGLLGVMTGILDADARFTPWWYVRDPTHVAFYRRETLEWIARERGWKVELPARNVAIYRKP